MRGDEPWTGRHKEVADGIISVGAVLLRLIGPEGAGSGDKPIQIIVTKRSAGSKLLASKVQVVVRLHKRLQ